MKKLFLLIFIPFIVISQGYDDVYNDVEKIPERNYNSIMELHDVIVKSHYSDIEKVYAFAKFITDKIAYGERAGAPLNCVNSGEGVCQDYSELFEELCKISGIENNFVTGMGTTSIDQIGVYDSNHAWNVVKLNGKYMIFDLTWAAGTVSGDNFNRMFNPKYFNSKPEDFIRDHFPDDSKWQLLDDPVSKKDYINAPLYDSEFENLSLKNAVVKDSKVEITFNSNADFNDAILFKWKLNDYGFASGKSLDFTKVGNFYRIKIEEPVTGAYRYQVTFKYDECTDRGKDGISDGSYSCPEISFILVTPGYSVTQPTNYDKKDPWDLIEPYHYIFHKNDFNFFKKLNPNTSARDFNDIKHSRSLNKSLFNWYGNYRKFYTDMGGGYIYYKIDNFKVVLSIESDGYNFKEIKREVLRLGKSGFGVKELQRVFGLVENGYFDNTLELEIKNFQKINGLKVDGIVGKMTYQALGIND